jgi:hypothetical protein
MKRVKIVAGIIWAFIGLVIIIILFPGLNSFSASASKLPFMKINPNYSGGEVANRYISEGCTLVVRKPVFDGLIRERKSGFVQIDWRGNLPGIINDTIDYNTDSRPDFVIRIDSANMVTSISPLDKRVGEIMFSGRTSYGWAVRVRLKKDRG